MGDRPAKPSHFREVKLRGKITGKIAYMVIIDEDDQNEQPNLPSPFPKNNHIQRIAEEHIHRHLSIDNPHEKAVQSDCPRSEPHEWMKKVAVKTVQWAPQGRIMTRSSKCKSQCFYEEKNYAVIPNVMDRMSFQFKKLLIKKCVSLRNREYIILE